MSITRTSSGRLDLTDAHPYEVFVVRLKDGSMIRFKPESMGNQYVLYIDKDTTDKKVLSRLNHQVHHMVHPSGRTWIERVLEVIGLLVLPNLEEIAAATQYLVPINRYSERFDRSPVIGEELYVLPHYGPAPTTGIRLGIVVWASV